MVFVWGSSNQECFPAVLIFCGQQSALRRDTADTRGVQQVAAWLICFRPTPALPSPSTTALVHHLR
ncbi:hypothetical protein E2C01_053223 [Portunus trituberculatus]|uniref:Uncharacterized protein n=1 Tax=Portunus trituberculatus TaxID=210409 RepID=A0A5B7GPR5_PORTR|nr:hypothetical protein [Portunus trituberculatus]